MIGQAAISQLNLSDTASTSVRAPLVLGAAGMKLSSRFKAFDSVQGAAKHEFMLCADIPDNTDPDRLHVKDETGHVFLTLSKFLGTDTVHIVFGFYPRRPASSILFKNVRCEILDNGNRDYDVHIRKQIDAEEFELMLETAVTLTNRKYNLNKYNCYDYALELVNSLPGIEKLQPRHIKFPFIFGRGGSPCDLYRDLEKLKSTNSYWSPFISFGTFKAPRSGVRR
jgi:hypothetical protein